MPTKKQIERDVAQLIKSYTGLKRLDYFDSWFVMKIAGEIKEFLNRNNNIIGGKK